MELGSSNCCPIWRQDGDTPINHRSKNFHEVYLVLKILKYILKVHNHLSVPVQLYFLQDTNLEAIDIVEPSKHVNLPMQAIYNPAGELYFKPLDDSFEVNTHGVKWRNFAEGKVTSHLVSCKHEQLDNKSFNFDVSDKKYGNTGKKVFERRKFQNS